MSGDTPAPGGSSFPAGNADPVAQPLSAEEERFLRGALLTSDEWLADVVALDSWRHDVGRLLATLDAARGSSPLTTQGPRSVPSDRPAHASHDATTPAGLDVDRALRRIVESAVLSKTSSTYRVDAVLIDEAYVALAVDPSGHVGPADLHDPRSEEQGE